MEHTEQNNNQGPATGNSESQPFREGDTDIVAGANNTSNLDAMKVNADASDNAKPSDSQLLDVNDGSDETPSSDEQTDASDNSTDL